MSGRLPMPYAAGFFRPLIVLPDSAADWDDRRRRAVLCHELAHLRRLDLLLNGLGQLACALWWFHPLVWVAARRLRTESERACDDLVLDVGTRASEYADHLLHIVCGALRARTPAVALPMAQRHEFEGRMLAILDRDARRAPTSARHAAVLGALAASIVLPLATLGIRTAEPLPGLSPLVVMDAPQDETRGAAAGREAREARVDPPVEREADRGSDAAPPPAARAQQDTGLPRVVAALMKALDDPVASVRKDAAYALGSREVPRAVPALAARLTRDPDADVREMTAWALGQIQSREASAALGAAAQRDSSEEVRGTAVWALGQLEDPQSVTVLAATLADRSAEVRGRAAWALGVIAARPAHPALVAALRDASGEVRMRAAWALGQIEDPGTVDALIATFNDPDADVRKAAFWAAAQVPGGKAEPALLAALEHEDPEIRAMAARALGGGGLSPWPWPWPWPR
jgi:HEAT repeat protein